MTQPTRILLTGRPGSGKATVILKTLELLERAAAGFYTEEVRERGGGRRLGFDIPDTRRPAWSSARANAGGPRVGRYGVDVRGFEEIGVCALEEGLAQPDVLLVIDELGKMELLSRRFADLMHRVFSAPNPILGTILLRAHPIADRFRDAPGVGIIRVDTGDRDQLPTKLAGQLRSE